jgi:hypothetical protein
MPQESFWDRLRGESRREPVGTLGDEGRSVFGVTNLEGNGRLGMAGMRIVFCDRVCRAAGIGEGMLIGSWATLGGEA